MADHTTAQTSADICRLVKLSGAADRLRKGDESAGAYLRALLEQHLYVDAIRYMAHAMPNREAVWWACLCARHVTEEALGASEWEALGSAVHWVLDPSPRNQKVANQAARKAGMKSPAGCAAKSASLVNSEHSPRAAKLAASAILLAVARAPEDEKPLNWRQFVSIGLDIVGGVLPWDEHAPTTSR